MDYPGFCGPTYRSRSRFANAERCMNLIPQDGDSSSGRELWLFPTPGKTVLGTLPTYPGRGCLEINGRAFAVSGSVLYEILDDWTYIVRGAMATDDLPATLSSSGATGNELFVTSGGEGYILDLLTNVFTNVVSDVNQGGYIGGYFVALDFATGTLKWSDLLDGLTWNGLSVQQRNQARINFESVKRLSAEELQSKWDAYQALSEAEKQHLAEQARKARAAKKSKRRLAQVPPPAPLTGAALEPAALRLVWSCVPEHGAQLHEVADACGLGLGATVTALHALETTYGYVTFDGAYWHALIPCGRQRGARP